MAEKIWIMDVRTGVKAEVEQSWGTRLIGQGRAVAVERAPVGTAVEREPELSPSVAEATAPSSEGAKGEDAELARSASTGRGAGRAKRNGVEGPD